MSYDVLPFPHLGFDDVNALVVPETGASSGGNEANVTNPNTGQLYSGGASNVIRNFPPAMRSSTLGYEDEERIALILRRNPSSSESGRLGTWCRKYLNSTKQFVRSRKVNLAVSFFVFLGSLSFFGMGFGYMSKCTTPLSFPTISICIGATGVMFTVSNLMILVESCRIRNRYNVFEWLTVGTLFLFGISSAVALWKLTKTEFEPALVIENAYKCDPVFVEFFKISTSLCIVFTAFTAVVYLPLLICCQGRCNCHRCS